MSKIKLELGDLPTDAAGTLSGSRAKFVSLVNACNSYPRRRQFLKAALLKMIEVLDNQQAAEDAICDSPEKPADALQDVPIPKAPVKQQKRSLKAKGPTKRATAKVDKESV